MFEIDNLYVFLHLFFGLAAIVSGLGALFSAKGSGLHRWMGKAYYYSMIIMALGAAISVCFTGQLIRISLPVLALYLVITAKREVDRKYNRHSLFDKTIVYLNLLNGIVLTVLALILLVGALNIVGLVTLTFGLLSLSFYMADRISILGWRPEHAPKYPWFFFHGTRMSFSFIFLVSGFFVNQTADRVAAHWFVVVCLLPFVFGIPMWLNWKKNYITHYTNWIDRSK